MDSLPDGFKPCASCKQVKPFSEFCKRKDRKGGLNYYCRNCDKAKKEAKALKNPKKPKVAVDKGICTSCGQRYERTPEFFALSQLHADGLSRKCRACVNQWKRNYYQENREHLLGQKKFLRDKDPEPYRHRCRSYYHANLEQERERSRERSLKEPIERKRERARKRYTNNPEPSRLYSRVRKSRRRANGGKLNALDIRKQFAAQKGKCWWCGTSLKVSGYHVDHVVALVNGGRNEPSNIVCACKTCNLRKGIKSALAFAGRLF